jgi:ketosteroid isomerase-like protein
LKGTYVNIWKKERDGQWKFIVNSNNPGVSNK